MRNWMRRRSGTGIKVIETYVRREILPKLIKRLNSEFEDRLFKGLDKIVGLTGQEKVEFDDELVVRMEGRPFSDYYEVAPDLMDEFYAR